MELRRPLTGAERMRAFRKRQREKELCIRCGRRSGDESRCGPCEVKHVEWMRGYRLRKAAA